MHPFSISLPHLCLSHARCGGGFNVFFGLVVLRCALHFVLLAYGRYPSHCKISTGRLLVYHCQAVRISSSFMSREASLSYAILVSFFYYFFRIESACVSPWYVCSRGPFTPSLPSTVCGPYFPFYHIPVLGLPTFLWLARLVARSGCRRSV